MPGPIPVGELDRKTYIGGAIASTILGLSSRTTRLEAYLRYIGELPPEEIDASLARLFKRGKRMEPWIIEDVAELYSLKIVKVSTRDRPNRYRDGEYAFLAAEIDFEWEVTQEAIDRLAEIPINIDAALIGTIQNGEAKSMSPLVANSKIGEEGTEEIPVDWSAQSTHGLGITGRQICLVAVGIDARDPLVYLVKREEDIIAGMREECRKFWFDNVMARVPPEPVNLDDLTRLTLRLNGRPVELDDVHANKLELLRRARAQKTSLETDCDTLIFDIGNFIRKAWTIPAGSPDPADNAVLVFGGRKIGTWARQSRTMVDGKRLRAEQPKIASEYEKTSEFRVMRISKS